MSKKSKKKRVTEARYTSFEAAMSPALLASLEGETLSYGTILQVLNCGPRHGAFRPSPVMVNALEWPGMATVTLSKPLGGLTLVDEVTVTSVVLSDGLRQASPPDERKEMVKSLLDPTVFLARYAGVNERARKRVNAAWARVDPGVRNKVDTTAHPLVTCLGAEERLAARRCACLYELAGEDGAKELTTRLFPEFARKAKDYDWRQLNEYAEAVVEEDWPDEYGYAAVAAFSVLKFNGEPYVVTEEAENDLGNSMLRAMLTRQLKTKPKDLGRVSFTRDRFTKRSLRSAVGYAAADEVLGPVNEVLTRDELDVGAVDAVEFTATMAKELAAAAMTTSSYGLVVADDGKDPVRTEELHGWLVKETVYLAVVRRLARLFAVERRRLEEAMTSKEAERVPKEDAPPPATTALEGKDALLKKRLEASERLQASQRLAIEDLEARLRREGERCVALEAEVSALRADVASLEDCLGEDAPGVVAEDAATVPERRVYPKGTLLFGGHPSWVSRFAADHPEVRPMGLLPSFPETAVNQGTPLVLVNPRYIGHKCYFKVNSLVRRHGVPVEYVGPGTSSTT